MSDAPERMDSEWYFKVMQTEVLHDFEGLLALNVPQPYYAPGSVETPPDPGPGAVNIYGLPRDSSGLFRGQHLDWPLIPRALRDMEGDVTTTGVVRSLGWTTANWSFRQFCARAEVQNPQFPSDIAGRLAIAQHFGVATPLLDWSRNVLAAAFFAIRDSFTSDDFDKIDEDTHFYIYHIIDHRLVEGGLPEVEDLADFGEVRLIRPVHIDRRIERQHGLSTFHPHPSHKPSKVPVNKYRLEIPLVLTLRELLTGLGFTEDYYFPDYAGIAAAVAKTGSVLGS